MKFKVGDKVKHKDFGVGEIIGFDDHYNRYAVEFEFENYSMHNFYMTYKDAGLTNPIDRNAGLWCLDYEIELVEEAPKNLIPQIAKMLGVEIGEEFYLPKLGSKNSLYIIDTEFGLVSIEKTRTFEDMKFSRNHMLAELLLRPDNIKKLPKKPILTEDEKVILGNLPKVYKWIERDEEGLYCYKSLEIGNPAFAERLIYDHLFQFIKWEDEEPYKIQELLKGEQL